MTTHNKNQVVDDLLTWEEENDRLLPFDPDDIAALEKQGFIVDLQTGVAFPDPEALAIQN